MTIAPTHDRPHARAEVKFVRMSASKVRVVLDLIRGDHVIDAIETLALSQRKAAHDIAKALRSAVANANHNEEIPTEELFVSACYADEGPTLKRFRPRARGRAGKINKRTCHITVEVARLTDDEIDRRAKRLESKGGAKKKSGGDRAARVRKSKKDAGAEDAEAQKQAVAAAEVEEEVVSSEGADEASSAEVQESEATSTTVDSDNDGEVNAIDESPYGEGSHALIDEDPDKMPEGFEIKGNASSKLYHVPGSSFYKRTKAEVWFASPEAAKAAGFELPKSQRQNSEEEE
jgi:large subunit ribosomal protein L22